MVARWFLTVFPQVSVIFLCDILVSVIPWHFLHSFFHQSGKNQSDGLFDRGLVSVTADLHSSSRSDPDLRSTNPNSSRSSYPAAHGNTFLNLRSVQYVFKTPWKQQVRWMLSFSKQKNNRYPLQSHKSAERDSRWDCLISEVNASPRVPEKNIFKGWRKSRAVFAEVYTQNFCLASCDVLLWNIFMTPLP